MNLTIVESPTKAKTITKFLKGYKVLSSNGHVRDLPRSVLGVDTEHNYLPKYVVPKKAKKTVAELKVALKKADLLILATDEDREGEAIAWHLIEALKVGKRKKIQRIVFHEITQGAIKQALKNPRDLDLNLIDAQQARRILDRLVGYKLSPFLWKKVCKGLSAGRVQSVAVRLIVDRSREIEKFKPDEYWSIEASLKKQSDNKENAFLSILNKKDDKTIDKLAIKNEKEAKEITDDLNNAVYSIADIQTKETHKNPLPPFITSTLQQEASRKLGWSARKTMVLAQQLYEGINLKEKGSGGLITYMRTDSLTLSQDALKAASVFIKKEYGSDYALASPHLYKTKSKSAQEAHEAIRPTQVEHAPNTIKDHLDPSQLKLYSLIWSRFVACQMQPAILDKTSIDIKANNYNFRSSGSVIKFDGWLKVYPTKFKESFLPQLKKEEVLDLLKLNKEQHFTQPPPKYTEASLIKILEEFGIGRPSTYAPTLYTIQQRGYVTKDGQKRFAPTEMDVTVTDILVKNFPEIVEIEFTANMEDDLDEIAKGKKEWENIIREFYEPFAKNLKEKYETVKSKKVEEKTDKICPKCGGQILIKQSRFGKFYACSNFPDCRHTESIVKSTDVKCPKCKDGAIVEKRSKKGRVFYGCSKYPDCDFSLWDKPTGEVCPTCKSLLVEKNRKIKCSNKECDFEKESE